MTEGQGRQFGDGPWYRRRGVPIGQNYDIPTEIDVTSGQWTVTVYCQPFHVIFATAELGSA